MSRVVVVAVKNADAFFALGLEIAKELDESIFIVELEFGARGGHCGRCQCLGDEFQAAETRLKLTLRVPHVGGKTGYLLPLPSCLTFLYQQ